MKATIIIVFLLALVASVTMASEVSPFTATTSPVYIAPPTATYEVEVVVPVSSFVEVRHVLTGEDLAYLATVPEYDDLREHVRQLMVAGIHHRPVSGRWTSGDGSWVEPMFQVWTGPYKATVRIPQPRTETVYVEKPLPPLGELDVRHTEPLRLCPIEIDLRCVAVKVPCAPAPCRQPARSLEIARGATSEEHVLGSAWSSWEHRSPTTPKHDDEGGADCPPDQHPPYEPAPEAPPEEPTPDPCS